MTDVAEGWDQAGAELSAADEQVLRELTERARAGGLKLTGEGGLLGKLTQDGDRGRPGSAELDDHLGYGKHDPAGPGRREFPERLLRAKTVLTDIGAGGDLGAAGPGFRFEPQIVAERAAAARPESTT